MGTLLHVFDLWNFHQQQQIFYVDSSEFIFIFFSVFVGAIIVTFNIRVLGGDISFFQSVAILGYCLFPIFMGIFILKVLMFFQVRENLVKIIIMFVAMIWSIICTSFNTQPQELLSVSMCPRARNMSQSTQSSYTTFIWRQFWLCEPIFLVRLICDHIPFQISHPNTIIY